MYQLFFIILINFFSYITSIYFAVTTMLTVGYGDVIPKTPLEKLFCVFSMLITCCVFAYSMNVIGNIIENLNKKDC